MTHGHAVSTPTRTYRSWNCMIGRCERPSDPGFERYGGVGVRVCDRWRESFAAFLADMGERPAGTTLDRIKSPGDYEPGNCRWATRATQSRNTSRNVWITAFDRTMCLEDWATHLAMHPETLRNRIRRGWSTTRALTEPVQQRIGRRG